MMWFDTRMAGEMFADQRWFHLSVFICFFFFRGDLASVDLTSKAFIPSLQYPERLRLWDPSTPPKLLLIFCQKMKKSYETSWRQAAQCETYWKLMFSFRSTVQLSNINNRSGDLRISSWSRVWGHLQPLMLDARVFNGNPKCFQHKSYLV